MYLTGMALNPQSKRCTEIQSLFFTLITEADDTCYSVKKSSKHARLAQILTALAARLAQNGRFRISLTLRNFSSRGLFSIRCKLHTYSNEKYVGGIQLIHE